MSASPSMPGTVPVLVLPHIDLVGVDHVPVHGQPAVLVSSESSEDHLGLAESVKHGGVACGLDARQLHCRSAVLDAEIRAGLADICRPGRGGNVFPVKDHRHIDLPVLICSNVKASLRRQLPLVVQGLREKEVSADLQSRRRPTTITESGPRCRRTTLRSHSPGSPPG